jgi:hypothetical protein
MRPARTNSGKERRLKVNPRRPLVVVAAILVILCGGCGSSSSSSSSNTMSAAQAQAVSQQVVQAVVAALSNAFGVSPSAARDARPSLSTVVGGIQPDQSSGCTPTATGQSCNFPLSYSGPCSGGGTISVSGDIDGTLNSSGSGSIDSQITITPANCSVSNLTFNGDPNISIGGQIGFTDAGPVLPITLMEGGGISYGPHPSGSCQLSVTYTINSLTSCTVTGMVCGQSVNGSC